MDYIVIPDRPRFLRPLHVRIPAADIAGRLKPLIYIVGNQDPRVTIAQGAEAVDNLITLLNELPELVGASGPEEFLLGYRPFHYNWLPEEDGAVLREWQDTLGTLYRMRVTSWAGESRNFEPPDCGVFRDELLGLVQDRLDHLLSARVAVWLDRRRATGAGEAVVPRH